MSDIEMIQPTIQSMITSTTAKSKRISADTSLSNTSLSPQRSKLARINKIDPIVIYSGTKNFDLSERIEIENDIYTQTGAEINFIMLDKYKNLLIFPMSKEDAQKIMICETLLDSRKKVDLSLNNEKRIVDSRPKLVIFGLTYDEALKYESNLKSQGIVEIINLQKKEYFSVPKIIKVVLDSQETADELEEEGEILILRSKFRIEKDRKNNKQQANNNSTVFGQNMASTASKNNNRQENVGQQADDKKFEQLFDKLNSVITATSSKLNDSIAAVKTELLVELKNNSLQTKEQISKNNANLAIAITEIVNKSRKLKTNELLKAEEVLSVIDKCCKIDTVSNL